MGLFYFKKFTMGMYYRMEYLTINGCLDRHLDEHGKVLPMSELCMVYKMTSRFTGHYYIGQTNNLKNRMYSHLDKIIRVIEGKTDTAQAFHYDAARAIKAKFDEESRDKRKKVKIEKFTRDALEVYILAIVADKPTATMVEQFYIKKHIRDANCINKR